MDLLLKDIFKVKWISKDIEQAKTIIRLIRGHQKSTALVREITSREPMLPSITRFAACATMLGTLVDGRDELEAITHHVGWGEFRASRCVTFVVTFLG